MWKCDKEKAKLQLLQYIADPRDGYSNAYFTVLFTDGVNTDCRRWSNDAMLTDDAVKALTVLTAWMIKNKHGFCPLIEIECNRNKFCIYPYVKKALDKGILRLELTKDNVPGCVSEAIKCIWDRLQQAYGTDDYLDI